VDSSQMWHIKRLIRELRGARWVDDLTLKIYAEEAGMDLGRMLEEMQRLMEPGLVLETHEYAKTTKRVQKGGFGYRIRKPRPPGEDEAT